MPKVFNVIATLAVPGPGDFYDIRPPIGEDWEVTELASGVWGGVGVAQVPQLRAGLMTDASTVPALIRRSGIAAAGAECNVRGWEGETSVFINHDCWLRLVNVSAVPIAVAATIRLVKSYSPTGRSSVVSGVVVLGGATPTPIIPPLGQDWMITDVGSSVWTGTGTPLDMPNVQIDITETGNLARVADGLNSRGWDKPFELYMNNTSYITLTPAGAATIGWSAIITKEYSPNIANSDVITRTIIMPLGFIEIKPPVGEGWKITDLGSNAVLTGVPPAGLPSILVFITDVTGFGPLLMDPLSDVGWRRKMAIYVSNTTFLLLLNAPGDIVGISGTRFRDI